VAFSSAAAEPAPSERGRWDGRRVRLALRVRRWVHQVLRPERLVGEARVHGVMGPDGVQGRAPDLALHKLDQDAGHRDREVPAQHKLDRDDKLDGDAVAVAAHTQK
jgi:hypothetical protein